MECRIIFVFFTIIAVTATVTIATEPKKYRDDYVYNRHTDAFYKLHTDSDLRRGRMDRPKAVCEVEGAELLGEMLPDDVIQVHTMLKNYPEIGDYVYIDSDSRPHHDSHEQQPIIDMSSESNGETETTCEVLTRDGTFDTVTLTPNLPFVCKVNAKDVPRYNPTCQLHARGYRYYDSVRSCYRIPRIAYTWYQAADECQAEGAHLAVINSETERVVLQNLTSLDGHVPNAEHQSYFHIGFKAEKPVENAPRVFKTIFNQTLEEAGFAEWSATEPNNIGGKENCGSVYEIDGKLNDLRCSGYLYAFICEKEVRTRL